MTSLITGEVAFFVRHADLEYTDCMGQKKLIVFFGKPGAGKSTIIRETFAQERIVDVKDYVLRYRAGDDVPEEKTIDGYRDMYRFVISLKDPVVVLELGTNHPVYNVEQLKALGASRVVVIFLCTASVDTLDERLRNRSARFIGDLARIRERLQRPFPNELIPLLELAGLSYTVLDMEQPWTDNVILINQRLRDA